MILLDERTLEARRSELEDFMAFLWDIGLEVGTACARLRIASMKAPPTSRSPPA